MTDEGLLKEVDAQRLLMISVSTGGPPIISVNDEYIGRRDRISAALRERGLKDPNPYEDLWAWRGKWSSGDLPTWQSRREYISGLYRPLTQAIQAQARGMHVFEEPTGWPKVDVTLTEIRTRLAEAKSPEQYQAVGLLCREVLITLAQLVHDPSRHPTVDNVEPSETDAKRKLDAYIAIELAGGSNEAVRKHAKASLDLANHVQHKRTASFRDAAVCAEATTSVVNLIAIISGQRDPE